VEGYGYGVKQLNGVEVSMKKLLSTAICIFVLSPILFARSSRPLANADKEGLRVRSIEQVLQLRESEVDLATAALIVSEHWSDMVYGREYLSRLDDMALEIRERIRQKRLRRQSSMIPEINHYLFDELGFESLSEAVDPNSLFLHAVLDEKRGYCLSLSILYLSIAERLDLPVYGVVVPGHFFVRFDDGYKRFNIETTSNGGMAPDEHYINKFKVPQDNGNGIYLKNLSKIQTLGCLFNNLGNSYSDIGNIDSAMLALARAVEINPTLSESRSNIGNIYLKKGRIADAIREYEMALQINPNDAKTHNNLGNAYTQREWLNYAVTEYNESIRLDPNFTDAYKNLAITYCKQQRFGMAISQLKQAISLEPQDAGSYSQMGEVYSQMGNYERAVSAYKQALKIEPDLVDAHYGLALCFNKLGMVGDEIWAYQKVLAAKPDMLAALVNLGNAYFGQEKYIAAIEQYNKAVQVEPDEAMIYYNLGAAYSNNDDYEQAVAAYIKAVEIDPSIGDAHYGLAFGFYQLENYSMAWKHIKIAKELGVEVTQEQLDAIEYKLR
jgi:tetratricopeptide (TPR) repeat protein